jgi:hypothetical protein
MPHTCLTALPLSSLSSLTALNAADHRPDAFQVQVRTDSWTEFWPDADDKPRPREVRGEIWNEAIAAALAKHHAVHIPVREHPCYLDGPIVLKLGQKLSADPAAEIRLKPGTNTCTVRNVIVSGVRIRDAKADLPIEQVVKVIEQKLNPDYPETTPRGGTGKGIWLR